MVTIVVGQAEQTRTKKKDILEAGGVVEAADVAFVGEGDVSVALAFVSAQAAIALQSYKTQRITPHHHHTYTHTLTHPPTRPHTHTHTHTWYIAIASLCESLTVCKERETLANTGRNGNVVLCCGFAGRSVNRGL